MIARTYTEADVLAALRTALAADAQAWAAAHGYSARHARDVAAGRRPIPAGFYSALGFEQRRVIVRVAA